MAQVFNFGIGLQAVDEATPVVHGLMESLEKLEQQSTRLGQGGVNPFQGFQAGAGNAVAATQDLSNSLSETATINQDLWGSMAETMSRMVQAVVEGESDIQAAQAETVQQAERQRSTTEKALDALRERKRDDREEEARFELERLSALDKIEEKHKEEIKLRKQVKNTLDTRSEVKILKMQLSQRGRLIESLEDSTRRVRAETAAYGDLAQAVRDRWEAEKAGSGAIGVATRATSGLIDVGKGLVGGATTAMQFLGRNIGDTGFQLDRTLGRLNAQVGGTEESLTAMGDALFKGVIEPAAGSEASLEGLQEILTSVTSPEELKTALEGFRGTFDFRKVIDIKTVTELTEEFGRLNMTLMDSNGELVAADPLLNRLVDTFGLGAESVAQLHNDLGLMSGDEPGSLAALTDEAARLQKEFGVRDLMQGATEAVQTARQAQISYATTVDKSGTEISRDILRMAAVYEKSLGVDAVKAAQLASGSFNFFQDQLLDSRKVFLGLSSDFSPMQRAFFEVGVNFQESQRLLRMGATDTRGFAEEIQGIYSNLQDRGPGGQQLAERFLVQMLEMAPEGVKELIAFEEATGRLAVRTEEELAAIRDEEDPFAQLTDAMRSNALSAQEAEQAMHNFFQSMVGFDAADAAEETFATLAAGVAGVVTELHTARAESQGWYEDMTKLAGISLAVGESPTVKLLQDVFETAKEIADQMGSVLTGLGGLAAALGGKRAVAKFREARARRAQERGPAREAAREGARESARETARETTRRGRGAREAAGRGRGSRGRGAGGVALAAGLVSWMRASPEAREAINQARIAEGLEPYSAAGQAAVSAGTAVELMGGGSFLEDFGVRSSDPNLSAMQQLMAGGVPSFKPGEDSFAARYERAKFRGGRPEDVGGVEAGAAAVSTTLLGLPQGVLQGIFDAAVVDAPQLLGFEGGSSAAELGMPMLHEEALLALAASRGGPMGAAHTRPMGAIPTMLKDRETWESVTARAEDEERQMRRMGAPLGSRLSATSAELADLAFSPGALGASEDFFGTEMRGALTRGDYGSLTGAGAYLANVEDTFGATLPEQQQQIMSAFQQAMDIQRNIAEGMSPAQESAAQAELAGIVRALEVLADTMRRERRFELRWGSGASDDATAWMRNVEARSVEGTR